MAVGALAAGCSGPGAVIDSKYGVAASPRVVADTRPIPKGGGRRQVGKPYTIAGKTYVPRENPDYRNEGLASWYGADFHGRLTANGEVYDRNALSAAHPTMPLPSYARVTNTRNGKSVVVRVNDRGPFHGNRIIDVSERTADLLGFRRNGIGHVRVTYERPADLAGSDDSALMATFREDRAPGRDFAAVPQGGPALASAMAAPAGAPMPQRTASLSAPPRMDGATPASAAAMSHPAAGMRIASTWEAVGQPMVLSRPQQQGDWRTAFATAVR